MRIGIDLDGVCYDFAESLRYYLECHKLSSKYNIVGGEPSEWDFYLNWGMSFDEFVKHCNDGVDKGYVFSYGKPRDNAPDAINFMKALGHEINIITDRSFGSTPQQSVTATETWLSRWGIGYDSLTFSADKTCVPNDYFIEDKLSNYDALEEAGVKVYLVNRPWNREDDNRRRLPSIQHFATMIGNIKD